MRLVVVHRQFGLPVGTRERRRVAVRAVWNCLVHRDAVEGVRRVVVRLAVELVSIVAVGRDHHVLAAVALEVAEAGVLGHLRPLLDALFQCLHERRAVLFGPLVVFLVHLVGVAFPAVEDALQFAFLVQRIDEVAIDDSRAEVPRATELVHEVGLVPIEEVDPLCEQADELGFRLSEGEVPCAVEVPDGVQFGVPEWLPVVFLVSGDDVPVEPAVVAFGLSARVVHAIVVVRTFSTESRTVANGSSRRDLRRRTPRRACQRRRKQADSTVAGCDRTQKRRHTDGTCRVARHRSTNDLQLAQPTRY